MKIFVIGLSFILSANKTNIKFGKANYKIINQWHANTSSAYVFKNPYRTTSVTDTVYIDYRRSIVSLWDDDLQTRIDYGFIEKK
jgi:hypothetical protein